MTNEELTLFLDGFETLMMASLTPDGLPHASTAAYIRKENSFYVLISTVAQHGRNLLYPHPVSLVFAEDETTMVQPFARKRVTLDAKVREIGRDKDEFAPIIERFAHRYDADLIASLSAMDDFHLFRLTVTGGSAVMGFGKAYRLNERLEVINTINGQHQRK